MRHFFKRENATFPTALGKNSGFGRQASFRCGLNSGQEWPPQRTVGSSPIAEGCNALYFFISLLHRAAVHFNP
jgi:hypothetical protein